MFIINFILIAYATRGDEKLEIEKNREGAHKTEEGKEERGTKQVYYSKQ